mgnify:FL=1
MATTGIFYFDGPSFADATSAFTDASLLTFAADGFYSIGSIYREQTAGLLGPVTSCPSCVSSCAGGASGFIFTPQYVSSETTGLYKFFVDPGTDTGAVRVRVNPLGAQVKFTWTYNNVSASEYTNITDGYLQGVIGRINSASIGTCENFNGATLTNALGSNGNTAAGTVFNYDISTGAWINSGTATTLGPYTNQAAGGVALTTNSPQQCYMAIPKPTASTPQLTSNLIEIQIEVGCTLAEFEVEVFCPTPLVGFDATSTASISNLEACGRTYNTTYYNMPANGATNTGVNPGVPQEKDWLFTDENGEFPVADGFWLVKQNNLNKSAEVENGVIKFLTQC